VSGQLHAPAALPPGKGPPGTHWIRDWVGPRAGLDGMERRKFLTQPGFNSDPSVVQPVASRYTDYAIPAHITSSFRDNKSARFQRGPHLTDSQGKTYSGRIREQEPFLLTRGHQFSTGAVILKQRCYAPQGNSNKLIIMR
jgi:hypothetical protein